MSQPLFAGGAIRFALAALLALAALHPAAAATKKPPLHPININSANSAELQQVPGIGPSTAEKILQMRKSYGAFKSIDDLKAVRGLGPKRLEKIRKYLTAEKSAPSAAKPTMPGKPAVQAARPATCAGCTKPAPGTKAAALPVPPTPSAKKNPTGSATRMGHPADTKPADSEDEEPELR